MGDPIRIEIDDAEIRAALSRAIRSLRDLRPLMKDIGEEGINQVDSYFDRETAPNGRKWRPLSPETVAEKRRNRKRKAILQRDGFLKRSITYRTTPTSVTIGTNLEYAVEHQPTRPFLSLGEDPGFVRDIRELIADYLVEAWEG